jgi:hypothetical protein
VQTRPPHSRPQNLHRLAIPMAATALHLGAHGCIVQENTPIPFEKLVCNDANNTILCWNERTCKGTPARYCAAHIDGDVFKEYKYPNAAFSGTCADPPEFPQTKCACEYGTKPSEHLCVYTEAEEAEDPTTGGPSPGPNQWICTTHAQSKCVEYNWAIDPEQTNYKNCWVDPNLGDNVQPCVTAADAAGAAAGCKTKCSKVLTDTTANIEAANKHMEPDYVIVGSPIDCNFDNIPPGDAPAPLAEPYQCAPEYGALVAWGGITTLRSVRMTAALATASGGSTGYGGAIGYIGYDVSECEAGTCAVIIDALETVKTDVQGIFTDATGQQSSYLLKDVDLHLRRAVRGTLHERKRHIVFPTEFSIGRDAGERQRGGAPFAGWETTSVWVQATGSLSKTGTLTLNLTMNIAGGVFTMAIVTDE